MKKLLLAFTIVALLGSCKKEKGPQPVQQTPIHNEHKLYFNWQDSVIDSTFTYVNDTQVNWQTISGSVDTIIVYTGDEIHMKTTKIIIPGSPNFTEPNGMIFIDNIKVKEGPYDIYYKINN